MPHIDHCTDINAAGEVSRIEGKNSRANPEEKRSENHRKSVQNSFAAKLLTS